MKRHRQGREPRGSAAYSTAYDDALQRHTYAEALPMQGPDAEPPPAMYPRGRSRRLPEWGGDEGLRARTRHS